MSDDRQRLQALLTALDATPRALRRDPCGTFAIMGKAGHIFADGLGYLLCVCTGELVRRWTGVKSRLRFCRVTQDGDDEGCLHLDRLPTRTEASAIREALGIRQRTHFSAETIASLRSRFIRPEKRPLAA